MDGVAATRGDTVFSETALAADELVAFAKHGVYWLDLGGRTRLTLRHTAFETDTARLDHQGGWTSAVERLATYITTDGAAA